MDGQRGMPGPGADTSLMKVPPQDLEAERGVLASILLNNDLINGVLEVLRPDDFYQGANRTLFSIMVEMHEQGRAIDQVTLSTALRDRGAEAGIGGLSYLADLIQNVPTTAHVGQYARIVKEKAILRRTIAVAHEIAATAFQGVGEVDAFLDRTEQAIFAIAEEKIRPSYYTMADMAKEAMREIEKAFDTKQMITGIPSGFRDLDNLTSGFQNSDLVVVAARPAMGKTSICLNIAAHAAIKGRIPVLIFSLEMSRQQLALRMICSDARVNSHRLRTGHITQDEMNKLVGSVARFSEAPIFIDDSGTLTPIELRAKARRLAKEQKIRMIIIDYLQLMQASRGGRGGFDNRAQEISEISRGLKSLAKELRIPVIAISQLNRRLEERPDKRPQMSDIRECVTGDARVLLADGSRVAIRELVGREADVWSMSPEGRVVPARCECVWSVGEKPVFRVSMASGRVVRATAEHRLYGAEGWVRVSHLSPGDRLAMARRVPEPANPVRWPTDRIILLAHLVGDGSYLPNRPLRYTTASEENSRIVKEAAEKEFGATINRHAGRGNWHQLVISGNGNRWHPAGVNLWLRELGIFGQRSHEKHLPPEVFRFDDEQVAMLLRHLWATDGSINCRKPGTRGSHTVYFATCADALASDVALLLLRLGIVARTRAVRKSGYRPVFNVQVSGLENQKRFLEAVGAFGPRVAPADRLWQDLATAEPGTNVDTLPKEAFRNVQAAMAAQGISTREMAAMRGTSYGGTSHFRFAPSRELIRQYANLLGSAELRGMATDDVFWDRVTDIRPDGVEEVFDMTVPATSCWLYDGILNHNSGAVEQDSDLILFVYREEVYAKKGEQVPPNVKGVAELIIGKHRNGPIGTVELAFIDQYTRFEDLARQYE